MLNLCSAIPCNFIIAYLYSFFGPLVFYLFGLLDLVYEPSLEQCADNKIAEILKTLHYFSKTRLHIWLFCKLLNLRTLNKVSIWIPVIWIPGFVLPLMIGIQARVKSSILLHSTNILDYLNTGHMIWISDMSYIQVLPLLFILSIFNSK